MTCGSARRAIRIRLCRPRPLRRLLLLLALLQGHPVCDGCGEG
jgi:hypothetical protein